jgi:hypothetical protein
VRTSRSRAKPRYHLVQGIRCEILSWKIFLLVTARFWADFTAPSQECAVVFPSGETLLPPHFPKEGTTITGRRKPLPQVTSHHQEHQLHRFIAACIGRLSDSSLHFTNVRFPFTMSFSQYLGRSGSPRPRSHFISPLHILGCWVQGYIHSSVLCSLGMM